jgi:hypothetical protein
MSTSVTQSGTTIRPGRSGRFLGVTAAGLAVVIAIGIVIAVNQGSETTFSGVRPEIASADFSWQRRTEFMEEQYAKALAGAQTASIGATIDGLEFAVQNAERALNITDQQLEAYLKRHAGSGTADGSDVRLEKMEELLTSPAPAVLDGSDVRLQSLEELLTRPVPAIQDASDVRFKGMEELLTDRAHAEQQAMWEQRYDDMVERFAAESNGSTGLRPLQGQY